MTRECQPVKYVLSTIISHFTGHLHCNFNILSVRYPRIRSRFETPILIILGGGLPQHGRAWLILLSVCTVFSGVVEIKLGV